MIAVCLLAAVLLAGCSDADRLYHGEIGVEQIDSPYAPEHIYFENDWLQKESLSAADGLNLQKRSDFFAYLDKLEPILLRYFIRNYELTDIMHYNNSIWAVRYALPEEKTCVLGYDYDVEIYYFSEYIQIKRYSMILNRTQYIVLYLIIQALYIDLQLNIVLFQ